MNRLVIIIGVCLLVAGSAARVPDSADEERKKVSDSEKPEEEGRDGDGGGNENDPFQLRESDNAPGGKWGKSNDRYDDRPRRWKGVWRDYDSYIPYRSAYNNERSPLGALLGLTLLNQQAELNELAMQMQMEKQNRYQNNYYGPRGYGYGYGYGGPPDWERGYY